MDEIFVKLIAIAGIATSLCVAGVGFGLFMLWLNHRHDAPEEGSDD